MARLVREAYRGKARVNGRLLKEWVGDIVDAIVERFDPLQVILFGSVARGDDGPDSDVDLLVVFPEIDESRVNDLLAQLSLTAGIGPATDVLVATPEQIRREVELPWTSLYGPIHEGRVVYERDT